MEGNHHQQVGEDGRERCMTRIFLYTMTKGNTKIKMQNKRRGSLHRKEDERARKGRNDQRNKRKQKREKKRNVSHCLFTILKKDGKKPHFIFNLRRSKEEAEKHRERTLKLQRPLVFRIENNNKVDMQGFQIKEFLGYVIN